VAESPQLLIRTTGLCEAMLENFFILSQILIAVIGIIVGAGLIFDRW
jgi:hypothetical protein